MRRAFFVLVFVLAVTNLFAQEVDFFSTEWINGEFFSAGIWFEGKNKGQSWYDSLVANNVSTENFEYYWYHDVKLTKEEWNCINRLLNRFTTAAGETYRILIAPEIGYIGRRQTWIIVEFTSNTQYKYWIARYTIFEKNRG